MVLKILTKCSRSPKCIFGALISLLLVFLTVLIIVRHEAGDIITDEHTYREIMHLEDLFTMPIHIEPIVLIGVIFLILFVTFLAIRSYISKKILLPIALFISSPPLLYGLLNLKQSLLIFIAFICLWTLIQKQKEIWAYLLSVVVSLASFPISIGYAFGLLAFRKHTQQVTLVHRSFLIIFCVSLLKTLFVKTTFIPTPSIDTIYALIQELGTYSGISFMMLILAILGAVLVAKDRSVILGTFLMICVGLFYGDPLLASIGILIFTSLLIHKLVTMTWTAKALQFGACAFILISVLNTGFIFTQGYLNANPSQDITEAYTEFQSVASRVVIAPMESSYYFEYVTDARAFANIDTPVQIKLTEQIYYSTDLAYTVSLLADNNISHIIITESMLQKIWSQKQKGLLIMLTNDFHFREIQRSDTVVIYEVRSNVP